MSCIVEANKYRQEKKDACPTCKQAFVGALRMAVAKARVHTTRLDRNFDPEAVSSLAKALYEEGNYPQALDLHQKVFEFQQQQLGISLPDVAATYINIGSIYQQQGKHSEALKMHQKGLAIEMKVHGPEHPVVADTQYNIGNVLSKQEKYPEALNMYEKALKTREKVLGREHPSVADTKFKCARLFCPLDSIFEGANAAFGSVISAALPSFSGSKPSTIRPSMDFGHKKA